MVTVGPFTLVVRIVTVFVSPISAAKGTIVDTLTVYCEPAGIVNEISSSSVLSPREI